MSWVFGEVVKQGSVSLNKQGVEGVHECVAEAWSHVMVSRAGFLRSVWFLSRSGYPETIYWIHFPFVEKDLKAILVVGDSSKLRFAILELATGRFGFTDNWLCLLSVSYASCYVVLLGRFVEYVHRTSLLFVGKTKLLPENRIESMKSLFLIVYLDLIDSWNIVSHFIMLHLRNFLQLCRFLATPTSSRLIIYYYWLILFS
jgi:hypothetical protein